MNFPDWPTVSAAVIALFTGTLWIGKQQQRLNAHDVEFKDVKAGMAALDAKMDEHTKTSADQWGQVQRALGRLEGHFGTKPETPNDG